eukprot:m.989418 g.989418  ORF g.989418 m.989418 type:complete len:177 (+) comp23996_c1_seq23:2372-2902(+)
MVIHNNIVIESFPTGDKNGIYGDEFRCQLGSLKSEEDFVGLGSSGKGSKDELLITLTVVFCGAMVIIAVGYVVYRNTRSQKFYMAPHMNELLSQSSGVQSGTASSYSSSTLGYGRVGQGNVGWVSEQRGRSGASQPVQQLISDVSASPTSYRIQARSNLGATQKILWGSHTFGLMN